MNQTLVRIPVRLLAALVIILSVVLSFGGEANARTGSNLLSSHNPALTALSAHHEERHASQSGAGNSQHEHSAIDGGTCMTHCFSQIAVVATSMTFSPIAYDCAYCVAVTDMAGIVLPATERPPRS